MADVLAERRREQEEFVALARSYVQRLATRLSVVAAAVVGSVARGDFNVWSDVDVVVVAEGLPDRAPDRAALLVAEAPPGVQPVGYTPEEFRRAWDRNNPLVRGVASDGVVLTGEGFFADVARTPLRCRQGLENVRRPSSLG